jgi:hypothetical protein
MSETENQSSLARATPVTGGVAKKQPLISFTSRYAALAGLWLTHLLIPAGLLAWLILSTSQSQFDWALKLLVVGLGLLLLFLAGYWASFIFYLRYLWLPFYLVAGAISFLQIHAKPLFVNLGIGEWIVLLFELTVAGIVAFLITGAIRAYRYNTYPVELSFPFGQGLYAINEGGNGKCSALMNYHYTFAMHRSSGANRAMAYAVDITKLDVFGLAARNILPPANEGYGIFHEKVLSPGDGEVVAVDGQWPNLEPFSRNRPYHVGNHVVLRIHDAYVLLGHLQQGSITVKAGDKVKAGVLLGQVGNSGWTDLPHLHIQAMQIAGNSIWAGGGLPIHFDGKNPVKNTLFRRK